MPHEEDVQRLETPERDQHLSDGIIAFDVEAMQ